MTFDARTAARGAEPAPDSEEFRRLADHAADVIARHAPSGRLVYASPAVRALLGYEPEFVTGRHLAEFLHADDVEDVAGAHRRVLDGGGLVTVTYRIRHRDGHYVWFETTSRALLDPATGLPVEIHASSRDVTARKVAEKRLARETDRLAALANLDLTGGETIAETLARVSEAAAALLPASLGAGVLLWDAARGACTTSAAAAGVDGHPGDLLEAQRRAGTGRRIVAAGGPLVVPDATGAGARAFVGVPIHADDEPLGVLYAFDRRTRSYADSDVAFLETLAQRAAAGIVTSRLVDELRTARRQAEALNMIGHELIAARSLDEILDSVAQGAVSATDADWALVLTLDLAAGRVDRFITRGPGRLLEPDSFDDYMAGLTGWAIRQNEVAFSPKGAPDLREGEAERRRRGDRGVGSLIVAPLVHEGRPVGTLTVMRAHDQPDYDAQDVRLVTSLAAQASVAIEQARLNDATRHALDEVQTLYELARVLGAAGSVDDLLQAIVDTVAAKLPADRVSLFGVDMEERRVVHAHRGGREAGRVFLEVPFEELLEGLTGWALRYGRPAASPRGSVDERESAKVRRRRQETRAGSIIVVPLRYRGATLGTLTAINDVDGPDFDEGDGALLQAMANQAAVAITDARLLAEVHRMAITDNLTGIANRGHLLELASREFASARRYHRPLGAVMFDVDHFKRINDTWGHAVGDEVLREIVRRCSAELREADVFGRYGGEEFVVVMPETGLDATRLVARRLRESVAAAPVPTADGEVPVTISVGVAHISQDVDSLPDLVDRADTALLGAKRAGRDRVLG